MAHTTKNPPAATGGLEGLCDRRAAKFHNPEIAQDRPEIHSHRSAWLARKFHLSLAMAEAVAEIAFNAGGAR